MVLFGRIEVLMDANQLRGDFLPVIGAAVFLWRNIFPRIYPCVPPDALGLLAVFREEDFKSTFPIVAGLMPRPLPQTVFNFCGDESSLVLCVGAVSVLVDRGFIAFFVFHLENIPLSAHVRHSGASRADELL